MAIAMSVFTSFRHKKYIRPLLAFSFALIMTLSVSGCAGSLPGGSDAVNDSLYDSNANLKEWVDSLEPGMSKPEVFARLGRVERDFRRLDRGEIVGTLFGGKDAGIPIHFRTGEDIMQFLNSLEGYRIAYKRVKRKHGFSSLIRIQTDEKGYDYEISLIFKNGQLYQKPFLAGGVVNEKSSKTVFDYLNPGSFISAAM